MFDYIAYTDGACKGDKRGGWGFVLFTKGVTEPLLGLNGFVRTTNNRMELMGIINALLATPQGSSVLIHSDSQYCLNPIKFGTLQAWKNKRFEGVKNADLWKMIHALTITRKVVCHWIKGHNGDHWNEIADALACAGADLIELKEDL